MSWKTSLKNNYKKLPESGNRFLLKDYADQRRDSKNEKGKVLVNICVGIAL